MTLRSPIGLYGTLLAGMAAFGEMVLPDWARWAVGFVGVGFFLWIWKTFIRRAIDDAGLEAARRNRPAWGAFLRDEVFHAEIAASVEREKRVQIAIDIATEAHSLAGSNATALDIISKTLLSIQTEIRETRREFRRALLDARKGNYAVRNGDVDDEDDPTRDG